MHRLAASSMLLLVVTSACDSLSGLSDFRTQGVGGAGGHTTGGAGATNTSSTGGAGGRRDTSLAVAEELLVDLRAEQWREGDAWANAGSLGGSFAPDGEWPPVARTRLGHEAACFRDESAFVGPVAPATLVGDDSRTVEVWVFNDALKQEETMVSWGHRGTNFRLMSFNYGANDTYGAVGHFGLDLDLGWMPEPAPKEWHHLVYTFDGTRLAIYADGALNGTRELTGLDTFADQPIVLGAQWSSPGALYFGSEIGARLCLGVVRVHAGALDDADVERNWDRERGRFAR